jgi:hypothetical protein
LFADHAASEAIHEEGGGATYVEGRGQDLFNEVCRRNFEDVKERNKIASQLSGLDAAINALSNGSVPSGTGRQLSEAGRRAISLAAKKRWARLKAKKKA